MTADISVTANFAINTYTLTYTAGANGTTTGTLVQTVNHGDDGTSVTAIPDINYHFVDWSDASTDNPRIDTNVTADISVTANFAIDTFTLTYTAGTGGSISGTSPQTVDYGADGSPVTAVADPGYIFYNWSDASTDNPRTDTNVMADISVTAIFSTTVTLNSTADSYVSQGNPSGNNGTDTTMSVQSTQQGNPDRNHRSFMRFDVSSIPATAIILSANLRLYLASTSTLTASRNYDAHRITASWVETTIAWTNMPAVAGSPTSTIATGTTLSVWLSWDVASDVAAFVSSSYSNYGWRIMDQVESSAVEYESVFRAHEYTGTTYDPQLVVTYIP